MSPSSLGTSRVPLHPIVTSTPCPRSYLALSPLRRLEPAGPSYLGRMGQSSPGGHTSRASQGTGPTLTRHHTSNHMHGSLPPQVLREQAMMGGRGGGNDTLSTVSVVDSVMSRGLPSTLVTGLQVEDRTRLGACATIAL